MSLALRPRERWALLIVAAVIAATVLSVCDLLFDCGCRPPWAGAASHCNIHVAGPPDCPLCAGDVRFPVVAALMVFGAAAAIVAASRRWRASFPVLLGAGVLGYLVVAVATGVVLRAL